MRKILLLSLALLLSFGVAKDVYALAYSTIEPSGFGFTFYAPTEMLWGNGDSAMEAARIIAGRLDLTIDESYHNALYQLLNQIIDKYGLELVSVNTVEYSEGEALVWVRRVTTYYLQTIE